MPSSSSRGRPFLIGGLVFIAIALIANEWVLGASLTVGGRITNPASRIVLALFDVAALLVGLTFLVRRERAPWRQMLLSVVATLFTLGLAEGGLRLVFAVRSWTTPQSRILAGTIGWRPRANATVERDLPAFGHVRYQTTRDGFRIYGDPASPKRKVLVVGDSFTEGEHLSTGETYYELLAAMRPDLELFAIGGGGYGTLQEFMLVDEFVDGIKPWLVIVQMHPNDLINNSHALESRSTTDNNQLTRPYWENGRVVPKFPENPGWGPLYNLARHSYLLRLVNVNLTFLRAKSVGSIEQFARPDDPDVLQAVATTVELLQMIQKRAGVPVAVFSARPDKAFSFWSVSDVCRRAGVEFIPGVGEAVEAAHAAGEKVTGLPLDAHWNRRGNEIAAGVINAWLKRE
ncbi:MAG TPA: SGNH/GDSL hydrolase family protein [Vicinamibacterales bacterium]|nr:SGNH/GDSL hydrolase family protein [Vicinamibacterales bacterium]